MVDSTVSPATRHQGTAPAYTLIEMMIVMVILIVVMALVAPVIGGARNTAKQTLSRQLLNNLSQASQQFEMSERRFPGYFSATDMGSAANLGRGFTEAENILLDLASGRVETPPQGGPQDAILVGPTPTATTYVRASLIGAPSQTKGIVNRGYFTPDPKFFSLQDSAEKKYTTVATHLQLPDLVDGFGSPILAWRQDADVTTTTPFAARDSGTRASFYWASNAAFLQATKLGLKAKDQTAVGAGDSGSMLAKDIGIDLAVQSMSGLLGHPSFPASAQVNGFDVPTAARGKLVFQSAGTDGVFVGIKDRGGIIGTAPNSIGHRKNIIDYRANKDPMDNFDDILTVAGN